MAGGGLFSFCDLNFKERIKALEFTWKDDTKIETGKDVTTIVVIFSICMRANLKKNDTQTLHFYSIF